MNRTLHLLLCICVIGCTYSSSAQIIFTIAGSGAAGYTGDGGPATLATFDTLSGISVDYSGDIFVCDQQNNAIRKLDLSSGIISTAAGIGIHGYFGDGMAATLAKLNQPWGVVADKAGNLFIADEVNNRIRKVNVSGIITTIAGTGFSGYTGDGAAAITATMNQPTGIAVDALGDIYFADANNHVVRKINTTGIINTVAGDGTSGYGGDGGPALHAQFRTIFSVATDPAGNLYICDADNNRVRKVNTAGIVTTFAGNGTPGATGDGGPASDAQLNLPTGVCSDASGNIYIADSRNSRIRKVNTSGIISTIAGTGSSGFSGDGGPASMAQLNEPVAICTDSVGNIYFSDSRNARVRMIAKDLTFNAGRKKYVAVCQDVSSSMDSVLAVQDLTAGLTDTWSPVSMPTQGSAAVSYMKTSTAGINLPVGLYYKPNLGYTGNDSFTVLVRNGIDSSEITVYVQVNARLSYGGVINGPSYVCVGDTILLSDSTGSGTWSQANLNASVSGGLVVGERPGTDTIYYTISNSCGLVTVKKTITIHQPPDAGRIIGPPAVCMGSGATYIDTAASGIWASSNSKLAIAPSGLADGIVPGFDTIYYTVQDAFCRSTASLVAAIDSFPYAIITPSDTSICAGTAINISATPGGGAWALSNANASFSNGTLLASSPGADTLAYHISNACGTGIVTALIVIDSLPVTPTIISSGNTISVPAGYAAYQWIINDTPILGSVTDTYLVQATGTYSVYVKNKYGCSITSQGLYQTGCTPDDIQIYPNPTSSTINIKWCKKLIVRVFCEDGKLFTAATGVNSLDLSYLPGGNYLLILYDMNGNKLKTKRVTKLPQ